MNVFRYRSIAVILVSAACFVFQLSPARAADFEFKNNDRVVMLGDGLIEQEQYFGWIEVAISTSAANKNITFRNLGWNADTPAGKSRFGLSLLQAGREPADEGWKQLLHQIDQAKPTVVMLGYGMASALEASGSESSGSASDALGSSGVDEFRAEYKRLLAAIDRSSPAARLIFLSPVRRDDGQTQRMATLQRYAAVVRELAELSGSPYVDLMQLPTTGKFYKDPVHLNSAGYREAAKLICKELRLDDARWQDSPQTEALREVVLRKNRWWFHRSRPANMAYVFGFRKKEQGQNAVEIPQFDPLIAEEEKRIAALRGLRPTVVDSPPVRLESKMAKFTRQETPEFTVAEGLEVTLWAENPLLNKPIHMNFDAQGRLWVASSEAYPMIEVGQSEPDKIVVLEDTTGDGTADKSTVFADGLLIPTGVVPGNGGVYVAQSTDLLFLKDTDGDGQADVRRRVLSGFGTEDTHHNLHTLLWGPDGRLYMNQSIYTRTDTETPLGVMRLKAGGGFRLHPQNLRMQTFFRGLWNPWGHQFDAYGNSFLTDGAGFDGFAYALPGAKFNPTPNARRQLGLISPGRYPKFASEEIIYGDTFPPEWQGSIVTCDFRANRVTRFSISDLGAGFVTRQEDDLMRTSATSFRPIDVKQGPDGALYIADWSNPIINHGEVDFRDQRRDRWHGRIWRVAWKDAPAKKKTDLTQLSVPKLLDLLASDDRYSRDHARRVLTERASGDADVLVRLAVWLEKQPAEFSRLQGLWLHQSLSTANETLLGELLKASDPNVRTAAVRVLSDWSHPSSDVDQPIDMQKAMLAYRLLVNDDFPRVRLEAVRGLATLGTAEAAKLSLRILAHPMDRFLDHALWLTIDELSLPLMRSIEKEAGDIEKSIDAKQLEFVLTSVEPSQASRFLRTYLSAHQITSNGDGPWIELIGKAGEQQQLTQLYSQVIAGGFDKGATVRALTALSDARRFRKMRPAKTAGIEALFDSGDLPIRLAAIGLAGQWKAKNQVPRLAKLANSTDSPSDVRRAAIASLGQIRSGEAIDALEKLCHRKIERAVRKQALVSLASVDLNRAAQPFFAMLADVKTEPEAQELWRGILRNQDAGKLLASKLPGDGLSEAVAKAGVLVAREGRLEEELVAALMPYSGMTLTPEKLTVEKIAEFVRLVAENGDPKKGEDIYRRTALACVTCHSIGGVGGKVGPDMTSLGASAPVDYIVQSLFDPNAKIKEGYHSTTILTVDGEILTGVEVASNEQEIVLRTTTNALAAIPVQDIESKKNGLSLMPTGVIDRLANGEQIHLIAFLSQLGKPGNFDASRGGVARVYQILSGTHRVEQSGTQQILDGTLTGGWMPMTTRVNGKIEKAALSQITSLPRNIALVHIYARTTVEVAKDTQATFVVEGSSRYACWLDGKAIVPGESKGPDSANTTTFTADLSAGQHTVLVRIDAKEVPDALLIRSGDVTFAVGTPVKAIELSGERPDRGIRYRPVADGNCVFNRKGGK